MQTNSPVDCHPYNPRMWPKKPKRPKTCDLRVLIFSPNHRPLDIWSKRRESIWYRPARWCWLDPDFSCSWAAIGLNSGMICGLGFESVASVAWCSNTSTRRSKVCRPPCTELANTFISTKVIDLIKPLYTIDYHVNHWYHHSKLIKSFPLSSIWIKLHYLFFSIPKASQKSSFWWRLRNGQDVKEFAITQFGSITFRSRKSNWSVSLMVTNELINFKYLPFDHVQTGTEFDENEVRLFISKQMPLNSKVVMCFMWTVRPAWLVLSLVG